MAIFNYYIDHASKVLSPKPSEGYDRNLEDTAEFAALTTGMSEAKKAVYKMAMQNQTSTADRQNYELALSAANLSNVADFNLNVGGKVSPHKASAGHLMRNNIIFKVDEALQIELIDVMAKITQKNKIVSTELVGRSGTVKEYIQASDYEISLTGQLISDSQNAFPYYELTNFVEILKEDNSVAVSSVYLNSFGVHRVVLKSATFDQPATKFANTLFFQLELVSDEDVKLTMEDY